MEHRTHNLGTREIDLLVSRVKEDDTPSCPDRNGRGSARFQKKISRQGRSAEPDANNFAHT